MNDDKQAGGHVLMDEHMAKIRRGAQSEFAPELMARAAAFARRLAAERGTCLSDLAYAMQPPVQPFLPMFLEVRTDEERVAAYVEYWLANRAAVPRGIFLGALENLHSETQFRKADELREEVESFLGLIAASH
jgi:hypothetical protein